MDKLMHFSRDLTQSPMPVRPFSQPAAPPRTLVSIESLISPPQSAKDLKQVLGRIHRAGSKSKAIQKIIYVAGTVEEKTCKSVRKKLNNLSELIDGDLSSGAGF